MKDSKRRDEKNTITTYEYGCVEILFCNSFHELPLHSHESCCIGMVLEGEVVFEVNEMENMLRCGSLFLIPSNTGVKVTPISRYKYVAVCIKNELSECFTGLQYDQFFLELDSSDDFMNICCDFMWNKDEKKLVEDVASLVKPLLCVASLKKHHRVSEPVQKAITYMKTNADQKFDLDELAKASFVSKYHLVRQFKKEMGVSPHQYYIQTKLRIAKKDFLADKTESEIAAELNFSDQSHLCRQFKQMMGVSLQEYKKNLRKNDYID